ncbi:MAG: NDP-sugar synthase [Candidatus Bathyarchaeia archaeon]
MKVTLLIISGSGCLVQYLPENLRVIIPIGGRAKRLLPLTAETSKACIRLLNRPLIEIALLCLANQGVKNFIFGVKGYTNYRNLHDYFESGIGFSAKYGIEPRIHIKYQPNVEDCGSADSARINIEYYDIKDPIFAVQGDNIFDVDLKKLMEFHVERGAMMTIGLREVEDVEGFGIADIDEDMRIRRFVEKPSIKESPSNLANTGLYLVTPQIREVLQEDGIKNLIRERGRLDFGYDLIPYLIETGRKVYGYKLSGSWYDVGTPERYLQAMKEILHGRLASLQDFGGRLQEGLQVWVQGESLESIRRRKEIVKKIEDGSIGVEGAVLIGRHCQIGAGVFIKDSCIDNYTKVEDGATIEDSAIMDRTVIGRSAYISNSIVARHVTIKSSLERPTKICGMSVVADDVTIEEGCTMEETKVYPHLKVRKGTYMKRTIT